MDLDIQCVSLGNAFDAFGKPKLIPYWHRPESAFIALGDDAAKALSEFGLNYFKLPHPTKLPKDKQQISRLLYRCKKFIYE